MSRVILKKYDNGEDHIVVGWDRPLATFYWQEFNKEPAPDPESGEVNWDAHDGWEEMLGFSGYMPSEHPTVSSMVASMPPKYHVLITSEVSELIESHVHKPDESGRIIVDMTESEPVMKSYAVEVQTIGSTKFTGNGIRLATEEEAEAYARDLAGRWTMVQEHRVVRSQDEVNYKWQDGRAVSV